MEVYVDWKQLNKLLYDMKAKKLFQKLTECMDEEGVKSCVESTVAVLQLLPDCMKEDLIDKLIQTIDETTERLNMEGAAEDGRNIY